MQININLNEVKEKPLMPADQPFTFAIKKASLGISKTPNKKTGNKESYIGCELTPLEAEWREYTVYHNWSLSPGALSSPDATFSIKKFFEVIGFHWNSDGSFNVEDLQTLRFVGKVGYDDDRPNFPRLTHVLQGAS